MKFIINFTWLAALLSHALSHAFFTLEITAPKITGESGELSYQVRPLTSQDLSQTVALDNEKNEFLRFFKSNTPDHWEYALWLQKHKMDYFSTAQTFFASDADQIFDFRNAIVKTIRSDMRLAFQAEQDPPYDTLNWLKLSNYAFATSDFYFGLFNSEELLGIIMSKSVGTIAIGSRENGPKYVLIETSIKMTQEARGKGLGTQFLSAVSKHLVNELYQAGHEPIIIADIDARNLASKTIHEKLGFVLSGSSGRASDTYFYYSYPIAIDENLIRDWLLSDNPLTKFKGDLWQKRITHLKTHRVSE